MFFLAPEVCVSFWNGIDVILSVKYQMKTGGPSTGPSPIFRDWRREWERSSQASIFEFMLAVK